MPKRKRKLKSKAPPKRSRSKNPTQNKSTHGSKDHVKVQGEILEGLVARIVNRESSKHMEKVLNEFQPPPLDGGGQDLGPSLRDLCAANRSDEKQTCWLWKEDTISDTSHDWETHESRLNKELLLGRSFVTHRGAVGGA
ncbi:hypothetical protein QJS04_geneDACA010576 [Acorus gramineus]|uniref:Uncharacterized protein n=1 Tax=Acorus gramineus TaxID=55184 RepID=A0AAV9AKY2_ACOGR|nr:hypothetical protein QJS04_geneDACA010576 [Acorus gramineus]